MEDKKIIVVIDTKNDRKNIIRTVNCIRRQTAYEDIFPIMIYDESMELEEDTDVQINVEKEINDEISETLKNITVVREIGELKKIIKKSNIPKLLFINTQIILAPNAIKSFIGEQTDELLALTHLIADSNGEYKTNNKVMFSPYCKLYNTDELLDLLDKENKIDKSLQLQYMLNKMTTKIVDAYSYQIGDLGLCVNFDTEYEFIKGLMDNEDFFGIDVVTDSVEKVLYEAFEESICAENEQAYSVLQKSFETLTFDEDVLELECQKYSITPELFKIIGRCNVVQFKKMHEKFQKLGAKQEQSLARNENTANVDLEHIENMVNDLRLRISNLEQEQNGYAVAQNVVGMYKDGKLGMGTIIKSAFAWIKYKVLGKR